MSSSEPLHNSDEHAAAPLDVLRQFARKREMRPPMEQCELCTTEIPADHRHLLELSKRTLICVCRPCSILFGDPSAGHGKYRLVPSRYLILPDFQMTDEQWDDLMIPVNMVFIFHSTNGQPQESLPETSPAPPHQPVTAYYPSPAGAMESTLTLEGWDALASSNPILNELDPDVEALLINRVRNREGQDYREHYIVPIDICYELVGLIRLKWRGLSGGEEAWNAIDEFFARLRTRATPVATSSTNTSLANSPYAWERRG